MMKMTGKKKRVVAGVLAVILAAGDDYSGSTGLSGIRKK